MSKKIDVQKIMDIVVEMNDTLHNDNELEKLASDNCIEVDSTVYDVLYYSFKDRVKKREMPLYDLIMEIFEMEENFDFILGVLNLTDYTEMKNYMSEFLEERSKNEPGYYIICSLFADYVYYLRNPEFRNKLKDSLLKLNDKVFRGLKYIKDCFGDWQKEYCDFHYIVAQKRVYQDIVCYDMGRFIAYLNWKQKSDNEQTYDEVMSDVDGINMYLENKYYHSLKKCLNKLYVSESTCYYEEFKKFFINDVDWQFFKYIMSYDKGLKKLIDRLSKSLIFMYGSRFYK